jgi:hypothetical protein
MQDSIKNWNPPGNQGGIHQEGREDCIACFGDATQCGPMCSGRKHLVEKHDSGKSIKYRKCDKCFYEWEEETKIKYLHNTLTLKVWSTT